MHFIMKVSYAQYTVRALILFNQKIIKPSFSST